MVDHQQSLAIMNRHEPLTNHHRHWALTTKRHHELIMTDDWLTIINIHLAYRWFIQASNGNGWLIPQQKLRQFVKRRCPALGQEQTFIHQSFTKDHWPQILPRGHENGLVARSPIAGTSADDSPIGHDADGQPAIRSIAGGLPYGVVRKWRTTQKNGRCPYFSY